jgi:Predicted integral membrane protein
MKRLLLTASVAALLLASTGAAFAQPERDHGWQQRHGHDRGDRDDGHRYHRDRHGRYVRHDDGRHDNGRHLGWYKQSFRRGQRVPAVYLAPRYYVNDYRAYRLAPPPRGYRWVRPYRDSNEYLLVQVATGVILQVLGY